MASATRFSSRSSSLPEPCPRPVSPVPSPASAKSFQSRSEQHVESLEGHGQFAVSWEAAHRYLARSSAQRVLISGVNDEVCRGALAAFSEAGRAEDCIVVEQNASMEVRQEMRRPGSRFVGSVGYFPEQYGEAFVSITIRVLESNPPPPSNFVEHQLITFENVDLLYPNDSLSARQGGDSILYSGRSVIRAGTNCDLRLRRQRQHATLVRGLLQRLVEMVSTAHHTWIQRCA